MANPLYTTAEAAKYLVPPVTQRRMRAIIKHFPNAIYRAGRWFIPKSDLDAENKRRETNVHIIKGEQNEL